MRHIIAISGKQFSGKDALAGVLLARLQNHVAPGAGVPWVRRGFADALKLEWARQQDEGSWPHLPRYPCETEPEWRLRAADASICVRYGSNDDIIGFVNVLKNRFPAVRRELITFGQNSKVAEPTIWVRQCLGVMDDGLYPHLIIPDVRFLVETGALLTHRLRGGLDVFFVRVDCDRALRKERAVRAGAVLSNEDDASERELDEWHGWNLRIDNEGTPVDLDAHAQRLLLALPSLFN